MKLHKYILAPLIVVLSACSSMPWNKNDEPEAPPTVEELRALVADHPLEVEPTTEASRKIWREALKDKKLKIIVSTQAKSLWLMRDTVLLFKAPVAVGRTKRLIYNGKEYDFTTPVGKRKVIGKSASPQWTPPDWHYYEIAVDKGVQPVFLKKTSKITLLDSTRIEVRNNEVGRVNKLGNFWPFTPGMEIIFDGKVFVPPVGTPQRRIPDVLGTHKLDMGNGYLLHGTNEEGSIGEAVSHGCVRMYNADIEHLYGLVDIGAGVYIY